MTTETIITLSTVIVTYICGIIAKKIKWFDNHLIPIQNLFIGFVVAIVEFILTKDFNIAISVSGLIAGGTYDIVHNFEKMIKDAYGR